MQSDAEFYELGQEFPVAFVLLGQGRRPSGGYEGTSLALKRIERRIDLVLWPEDPAGDVWIVECHGHEDPAAERNLFLKAVLLATQKGLWGRIRTLLVYLTAGIAAAALPASLGRRGRTGKLRPVRVVLDEMRPEELLRLGPELFPLLPLSRTGREEIRSRLRAWMDHLARSPGVTSDMRRKLFSQFARFYHVRFAEDTLLEARKLSEEAGMSIEETRLGRDLIDLGKRAGKREGKREGQRAGFLESILQAIEIRFGRIPEEVPAILKETKDLESLREILRLALSVRDLRQLRRELAKL